MPGSELRTGGAVCFDDWGGQTDAEVAQGILRAMVPPPLLGVRLEGAGFEVVGEIGDYCLSYKKPGHRVADDS